MRTALNSVAMRVARSEMLLASDIRVVRSRKSTAGFACRHTPDAAQRRRCDPRSPQLYPVPAGPEYPHLGGRRDLVVLVRPQPQPEQIGRASGRDSVCQYVWISVVAESLTKKKT